MGSTYFDCKTLSLSELCIGTNEGGWTIPNEGGVCTLVTVVRIPAGKLPNKTAERCIHLVQTSKWIFYYQVQ